ncbi:MAG: hypothetical protein J0L84_17030, partial [Verrucomicrobia bacterium]|nr:hypothetical protein [Verrucomicrobiota bacterium]
MPSEILPDVFRWSEYSPAHKVELASHAVWNGRRLLVFDPIAFPRDLELPGGHGDLILLTNENHVRAASTWSADRHLPVWCAPEASVELPGVRRWGPEEDPTPDWIRIPLPGGPGGETAFFDPTRSLMVFGDAVVNLAGCGLEILPDKYCTDPVRLRKSLRKLPPFVHAVFAHGDPLIGG